MALRDNTALRSISLKLCVHGKQIAATTDGGDMAILRGQFVGKSTAAEGSLAFVVSLLRRRTLAARRSFLFAHCVQCTTVANMQCVPSSVARQLRKVVSRAEMVKQKTLESLSFPGPRLKQCWSIMKIVVACRNFRNQLHDLARCFCFRQLSALRKFTLGCGLGCHIQPNEMGQSCAVIGESPHIELCGHKPCR